jgi:nitrite reductase/ring-hydroxylating ferredoxin subunit
MLDPQPERSIERHAELAVAGIYEREVRSSIEGVWENVFDWEHLPWVHAQAFRSIELRAAGDWGWHADVGFPQDATAEIELIVDAENSRYVARTRSGPGAPGETWTTLTSLAEEATAIRVEFCVTPLPIADLERLGAALCGLYKGLWDQDEDMMRVRGSARARRSDGPRLPSRSPSPVPTEPLVLGEWDSLRERLPVVVEFGGHRFRIVERGDKAVAYAAECPHWLGPLDECAVEAGVVTCPWHGYRFDVESGRSADGRGLRLRPAPRVEIDPESGAVQLVSAGGGKKVAGL